MKSKKAKVTLNLNTYFNLDFKSINTIKIGRFTSLLSFKLKYIKLYISFLYKDLIYNHPYSSIYPLMILIFKYFILIKVLYVECKQFF
jgi:hypothetical protein